MANPDAADAPKPPPHLRVSENEEKECDTCTHYMSGKCHLYNDLPVDGEWICDSWEKGRNQDADDDETPSEQQPKNFRDARVRVREHFRRARQQAREQQPT